MSSKLVTNLTQKHLLLTFDAFGTLYKPRASISATYARIAKKHGIQNVNEEELAVSFKKAFKSASKQFPNYGKAAGLKLEQWWTHVIRDSFEPVTSRPTTDAMVCTLMEEFSGKEGYCLFDDVIPFFAFLKDMNGSEPKRAQTPEWPWKSTTVGIISNSDFRVGRILASFGLNVHGERKRESENMASNISFVTTSYDVGVEKPDAKIFQAAREAFSELCSSAGIPAANMVKVHVGDDLEKDVFGAIGAGWTPIFLDRESKYRSEKEGDKHKNLTTSVTHPVTHEEKEVSVINNLSELRLRLPSTNFTC